MRVTFGLRRDAAEGTEFSYWGSRSLKGEQARSDAANRLNAQFVFDPSIYGSFQPPFSGFYNANAQTQLISTQFHSFEYNRTKWAWDVFKSFYGLRTLYFDDRYMLASHIGGFSNGLLPPTVTEFEGVFSLDTQNILFGPQIGTEYFYDVGYRVSFSLLTKVGIHANFTEMKTRAKTIRTDTIQVPPDPPTVTTTETPYIDNVANKTKVAGTFELGFQTHYQLAPQSRLRCGYNALWMWGVITAEDNFPTAITPFTGFDPKTNHSAVLVQGINFGLEFYR